MIDVPGRSQDDVFHKNTFKSSEFGEIQF